MTDRICTCNPVHLETGGYDKTCERHNGFRETFRHNLGIKSAKITIEAVDEDGETATIVIEKASFPPNGFAFVEVSNPLTVTEAREPVVTVSVTHFIDIRGQMLGGEEGAMYSVTRDVKPATPDPGVVVNLEPECLRGECDHNMDHKPSNWNAPEDWS